MRDSVRPLDANHRFWRMLLEDKIRPSPKPPPANTPKNILDVGCGLGSLCLDMAHENPSAHVYGIDLKPVPLEPEKIPINCTFVTGCIFTTDAFEPGQFDFVISRDIRSEILVDEWGNYVRRLFELLRRGGSVYFIEMDPWPRTTDGNLPAHDAWVQYSEAMQQMMQAGGLQFYGLTQDLAASIEALKPTSKTVTTYNTAVGKWMRGNFLT